MKLNLHKVLLFFTVLFLYHQVSAQEITVSGVVTDENKVPLPGVNVILDGSSTGTTTDFDGNFEIMADENQKLVFSSVGFQDAEYQVGDSSEEITIVMKEGSVLDEVVLIGFGSTKRKNLTSAVSKVNMEDVNTSSNTNFTQALGGRAAGVTAISTSGQPGAAADILIRSNASFASGGPLYVVDGVIINDASSDPGSGTRYGGAGINRSPLNFLNPNDIETIDILKDASATAIYGARAAGGVVLITTKKGAAGEPQIQYDVTHSFENSIKYYDLLNTKDYMHERNKILYEKWMLDNGIGIYGGQDPSSVSPFNPKYSDSDIENQMAYPSALDEIMRTGFTHKQNVSVSGQAKKTSYYISGSYTGQEGVLKHSDFKNFAGKITLDQEMGDSFKIGVNVITNGSKSNNGNIGDGLYENSGMIGAAIYHPPTLPFQDEEGNYVINPDYQNTPNPLSFLEITDYSKDNRLLTSGYAELEIIEGLTAKANFSYDQSTSKRYSYLPRTFLYGARQEGEANILESSSSTMGADYTLNYVKKIGDRHDLNVLLGHSYQENKREGFSAGNDHFPTDNFLFNDLGLGTADRPSVGSFRNPDRIWKSYFGRIIYELDDKYTLSFSLRGDGASHFAENKKWGVFPGVSASWVMSDEDFLSRLDHLNFLKLRVGYGEVGNSNIGSSAFAYYASDYANSFVLGNKELPGVQISQLANPNLTWETQVEKNIGLDFDFFNYRVSGSIDYYDREFKNLLSSIPLATDFPISSVATNAGKTKSTGFEFTLTTRNIVSSDGFNWSTTVNFSHYKNKWVNRSPESLKTLEKYINPTGDFNDRYGYLSDGIYNPETMEAPDWMPGILPGEVIIKDVNGYDENGNLTGEPDGKIDSADMVVIMKNSDNSPRYTFGIDNTFRYKNFDLTIFAYGGIQKKFNSDLQHNASRGYSNIGSYGWNMLSSIKDRWSYDNTEADLPTGLTGNYEQYSDNSDFWVEDASFLKIRDITLGYTFSENTFKNITFLNNARVFVNVQNPFVFTKYKGIDPELRSFYSYPLTKSVILGASITF